MTYYYCHAVQSGIWDSLHTFLDLTLIILVAAFTDMTEEGTLLTTPCYLTFTYVCQPSSFSLPKMSNLFNLKHNLEMMFIVV